MTCLDARAAVSARLDGEVVDGLDEHLAACGDCAAFARSAEGLRRALRFEAVGAVPDLAPAVRARLVAEPDLVPPTATVTASSTPTEPTAVGAWAHAGPRRERSTLFAAAAALIAGILIGANLVGIGGEGPEPVAAATLPERVVAAQGAVDGLHEELRLVERGWHPAVPERTYTGTLDYRAPESLRLHWRDGTDYPAGGWPANDVDLRTDGRSWRATGLADCPSPSQPCGGRPRTRAVTGRPPFADVDPVPLELIVPVRSFTRLDTAAVTGEGEVAGRRTVEVRLGAAQVGPLLDGLAPAGNLRAVHPTDEVALSLDAEHMVPLALRVTASDDPDRPPWAARRGYADHAGLVVLDLVVTEVDLDVPPEDRFAPTPDATASDAGFRDGAPELDLAPSAPAGFSVHRTGRILGATPTDIWSWSDGRAWIRLQATTAWTGPGLFGDLGDLVRSRPLTGSGADAGDGRAGAGEVWVRADGRRVGLHGAGVDLVIDGSVGSEALVEVLAALDVAPVPLPQDWPEHRAATRGAIRRAVPGALGLGVEGFERPVARVDGAAVVLVAAGAGDRSVRLDQVSGKRISPPIEVDYDVVRVRGRPGRFAPASGRLEWVEDGRLHILRGTGLTREELLAVADGLVPL